MVTGRQIVTGLKKLGLSTGDHVMVHSSLRSFGMVEGGAESVVGAILEVVGGSGTLLVPTNVFNGYVTDFLRNTREVDLLKEESRLGIITETVRKLKNSIRSCHPTHPVAAVGALSKSLLEDHHKGDSPAGPLSPYGKLAKHPKGKILMLGVSNSSNTTFHTAEEYYTPYIFNGERFTVRTLCPEGRSYEVTVKGYCTGVARNFTAADPWLTEAGCIKTAVIGEAKVILLEATGVLQVLKELLEKNPYFLVHESSL